MKLLFLVPFILFGITANATNYYISANGNDVNNGTSTSTPWKSLSKLNSYFGLLKPGDNVLFNRGDVFYGNIIVNKSGASGSPITIGAYGTGANPVITGFTNVTAWTNLGGNIWESTSAVSTLSTCNMVAINGVNTAMGRTPNTGSYYTYQSHTGTGGNITSSSLNSTVTNWAGAEIALNISTYTIGRNLITSQTGSTINYMRASIDEDIQSNNQRFIIQNDPRTLDVQNEWYYNSTAKKIRVYSVGTPLGVQVSTIDTTFNISSQNYIRIDGLNIQGANQMLIQLGNSNHVTIQNCNLNFSGRDGIFGPFWNVSTYNTIDNCTFNHCNNNTIDLSGSFTNTTIQNCTVKNTGQQFGMGNNGNSGNGLGSYSGILTGGSNTTVQNNSIDSVAYNGIRFYGNNTIVKENFITHSCNNLTDGGGIYTDNDATIANGLQILNNIVIGSGDNGIYCDAQTNHVEIGNNTVSDCARAALFINNNNNMNVHNNTTYNSLYGLWVDNLVYVLTNVTMKNNIFLAKVPSQKTALYNLVSSSIPSTLVADSNYYARPVDDSLSILLYLNSTYRNISLSNWKSLSSKDLNSGKSPKTLTDTSNIRFEYNSNSFVKTLILDANYMDVTNTSYNGSVTLAPYTSIVLIKSGAITNSSPVANAGNDLIINLPVDSVTFSGSGIDLGDSITSYRWSKISGPTSYLIADSTSAITLVNKLVQGTYQFQLTVNDSRGGTGKDTIILTVNAPNIPPVVNAGNDQTITLPLNSRTLSGSGNDVDGIVTRYLWSKISGPANYNIVNSTSAVTTINELVQGTYQFQLKVTDDDGATSADTVVVTVNAANITPIANAGQDQIITLPSNSLMLSGSGKDTDGTIAGYLWTKISGPESCQVSDPTSAITNITRLVQGVYEFELKVSDNNGALDRDTVMIIVNPANILPVANAGIDQTLTLPSNSLTLSGSANDADGIVVGYLWTKISGPDGANITNPTLVTTSVTNLIEGVYKFALVVTDNNAATGVDTVLVTVNAAPNQAPVADAGIDQTIVLPIDSLILSGSGNDADGTVISYLWTKVSGPATYTITDPSAAVTNVKGLVQGVYIFQLQVTDVDGAVGMDVLQVTVNAAPNSPPVADAGLDQTITLPGNTITLSGSGKDSDGIIINYIWSKLSGPANYNITNVADPLTTVTNLVQGVYQFQLQVVDNSGAIGTSQVTITVNNPANIAPTADAGPSQSITLPVNSVILSGIGSDQDGTIVNYTWTKISGSSHYNIVNATSPVTAITGLSQGTYRFQLSVTDNGGAIGISIVQITVNNASNIPPVANAGSDQIITLPNNKITLSGSGSDADGSIVGYSWTQISGPSPAAIANSISGVTEVTGLVKGSYQFELVVTDNDGGTGTSIVAVVVNAPANIPPVVDAGPSQSITLPVNYVTLLGRGSDTDGIVASYHWIKISGIGNCSIANSDSTVSIVSGLTQGVYQFELQVTDNNGATGTAIVQITVNAPINVPPVANAGSDLAITLPVDSLALSGSGTDQSGAIISYAWTKIAGPSNYNIINPAAAGTVVTGLTQGIYQFQLEVTDDSDAVATDTIQVIVNPSLNIPPVANAGGDQSVTLPLNYATLSGSGTDADGTIEGYLWTKISGPSDYNIVNPTSSGTILNGLKQGIYQFKLEVTDNSGANASDTVIITVNAAGNISPIANAGSDQIITLPLDSVSLSGSGIDSDGTVTSYLWTKISGPSTYNIENANSSITKVNSLVVGVYQFQLQVIDNKGAIGNSIMQVTVKALPNQPPVADAGPDQTITLPENTITLYGKGIDPDGTIASYSWARVSGPSAYNIANASSSTTNISNLVNGIYRFQLKVYDNSGDSAVSVVKITVNAAPNMPPVANAGADQIITLPNNTISLAGSATDADGLIVRYQWIKISGPANYNIVNATSPVTDVSGLSDGTYQFQLKVTDNNGAIGTAAINIIVNPAINTAPVANAGSDQMITLPVNTITLSGSGTDLDGKVVSYAWTKISGPASYNILNAVSPVASVTNLVQGIYQFKLEVTDNNGTIGADIIQVTVNTAPNQPPVANAGADQTITLPVNGLTLSGSGIDLDGSIVKYNWTKISGPSNYNIGSASSAVTNISGLVRGVYQFQLKITDNSGATSSDIIQLTVNAAPNQSPVANAGSDISITLPVNQATLSGIGTDPDGNIVAFLWTKISGPLNCNIVNANAAVSNVSGLVQGVYQFELKVTDNNGVTSTDIMQVTVNAALNQPPVANAGQDQTITLPVNSVILSGIGTDPDGTVAGYTWAVISGPSSFNIVTASSAVTSVTGLVQGAYLFELKVTDNSGARDRDTVQIIVKPAINVSPIANAGSDKIITLPVNVISLSGNGTDADGSIVKYAWTKISGPSAYNIVNAGSPITDVFGLTEGVYKFELKVTDNSGAVARDTVQVTVNTAVNIPPVANAGTDKIVTLPTSTASLLGSGSDVNGSIVKYLWTKISGPADYKIANAGSPVSEVFGLAEGIYQFELKVTDDKGAEGKDTVQVIVNKLNTLPVADAGKDQTITLPVNSVNLTGNGTDSDGIIVSYSWKQLSGPSVSSIISQSTAVTLVNNLQGGTYTFELTVTDNNGATKKDTVNIVVTEPRLSQVPISNEAKIYPNPVVDIATLDINTTQLGSKIRIIITSILGNAVYKEEIMPTQSNVLAKINFSNLAKGTYVTTIYFGNGEKKVIRILKL